uniref:basic proline-rich protein-like n=1 Tax=Agelaius phoeniceus TaxID=39638 RepID=UPI0023EAE6A5|nr:basic proline-rich protein-like [Agelaius phoeniceus]
MGGPAERLRPRVGTPARAGAPGSGPQGFIIARHPEPRGCEKRRREEDGETGEMGVVRRERGRSPAPRTAVPRQAGAPRSHRAPCPPEGALRGSGPTRRLRTGERPRSRTRQRPAAIPGPKPVPGPVPLPSARRETGGTARHTPAALCPPPPATVAVAPSQRPVPALRGPAPRTCAGPAPLSPPVPGPSLGSLARRCASPARRLLPPGTARSPGRCGGGVTAARAVGAERCLALPGVPGGAASPPSPSGLASLWGGRGLALLSPQSPVPVSPSVSRRRGREWRAGSGNRRPRLPVPLRRARARRAPAGTRPGPGTPRLPPRLLLPAPPRPPGNGPGASGTRDRGGGWARAPERRPHGPRNAALPAPHPPPIGTGERPHECPGSGKSLGRSSASAAERHEGAPERFSQPRSRPRQPGLLRRLRLTERCRSWLRALPRRREQPRIRSARGNRRGARCPGRSGQQRVTIRALLPGS